MQHIVAVIVSDGERVLVGKHRVGPFSDSWGVASAHCGSERPARAAGRIAEYATFGLLGARRLCETLVVKHGRTPQGMLVYSIGASPSLVKQIKGVTSYVTSCFALDERGPVCPLGLLPWTDVQWMSLEGAMAMKNVEEFSVEALRQYSCRILSDASPLSTDGMNNS